MRAEPLLRAIAIALALLGLLAALGFLHGCSSKQATAAQAVVSTGCTIVEAFSNDVTAHQICATEEEIAKLVDVVRTMRADAGPARYAVSCKVIPHTEVCATRAETVAAIDAVLAERRDR